MGGDTGTVDHEAIRRIVNEVVPYQRASSVTVTRLDGDGARSAVTLAPEHLNHVGTAHAALVFLAAEAAAGAAFVGGLGADIQRVVFVAKEASIRYVKPATGAIEGRAVVSEATRGQIAAARRGESSTVQVEADVAGAGDLVVAMATFTYHLRYRSIGDESSEG